MAENIKLYPSVENVFNDISLGIYFRPLLTAEITVGNNPYSIHLVATDGLFCDKKFKYSEQNFFGFKYNNGLYEFQGVLNVFANYEKIPEIHSFLQKDFLQNRDSYLSNKVKESNYLKNINSELEKICGSKELSSAEYYAEAFYSYEFTKYYYEKYGSHRHISVVTENYGKNTNPFLIDKNTALSILDEFFINAKYNLSFDYEVNKEMFVAGTARFRFMSITGGGDVLAMLDPANDMVYLLEYFS